MFIGTMLKIFLINTLRFQRIISDILVNEGGVMDNKSQNTDHKTL